MTPPDPILGIDTAVNHPNAEQRVSLDEAIRMFTLHAAYGGHSERRHGSIAAGMAANCVVLGRHPYSVDAQSLRPLQVLETWYLGRRVFHSNVIAGSALPAGGATA